MLKTYSETGHNKHIPHCLLEPVIVSLWHICIIAFLFT